VYQVMSAIDDPIGVLIEKIEETPFAGQQTTKHVRGVMQVGPSES